MPNKKDLPDLEGVPTEVVNFIKGRAEDIDAGRPPKPATLAEMLPGDEWMAVRQDLDRQGFSMYRNQEGQEAYISAGKLPDGQMVIAAGIPRRARRAKNYLDLVDDFQTDRGGESSRLSKIQLFHNIYKAEGLVSNGINKSAALVATAGSFKVRYVRGSRGKPSNAKIEEFKLLLQYWLENVNAAAMDAVVSGARGVQSFASQGVRQCLIEGDHFARHVWQQVGVPPLQGKKYSLPMNLVSYSSLQIKAVEGMGGQAEWYYWTPDDATTNLLKSLQDGTFEKNLAKVNPKLKKKIMQDLDRIFPKEVRKEISETKQLLLDPSLLIHIRHRGTAISPFGESFIEPIMSDIVYKRALDTLDLVTIENLINRLVIISIGHDNVDSPYHTAEISAARITHLQNLLKRVGPSATILWPGPDIKVLEVGAHDKILAMDERYNIARSRIKEGMGVPAVLLTGEGTDGKAAGYAASIGTAAQLKEIQNQYRQALKTIAERIAAENGFEDVEVDFEFHQNLLVNKAENATIMAEGLQMGAIDFQTYIEDGLGLNYEAVEARMATEVAKKYREEAFGPPKGAKTTNVAGTAGGGGASGGKTKKRNNAGKPDPQDGKERQKPTEQS